MKYRLLRFSSGVLASLSGFALWEIIQIKGTALIGQPSIATLAGGGCLVAILLGVAGTLASNHFWTERTIQYQNVLSYFSDASPPPDHWLGGLLISCSIIIYIVLMTNLIPRQPGPLNNDQQSFLTQAHRVQESGGPSVLIQQLYRGTYQEANQHPMYVALLSFFPDYETGKRLSAIFGICALLIFSVGIARHYGNLTGGLTGLLISLNAAYCHLTGRVVCEGLLLFFIACLWLLVLKLPDLKQTRIPYLHLTAMGLILGLAWLTKGTTLLIMLGLVIWFCSYGVNWKLLFSRLSGDSNRETTESKTEQSCPTTVPLKVILVSLCLLFVSFTLVASPLLVRNTRLYGSPTFNANSYLMFQDEFTEPHALIQKGSLGEAAQAYLQTHSAAEIIKREIKGLLWQVFIFLRSLGPLPFEEGRLFFGILALPFLLIGLISESHSARRLYLIWMLLFWLAFAWYLPIAAGERFLVPLLLPSLAFISLGIVRAGQFFVQRRAA